MTTAVLFSLLCFTLKVSGFIIQTLDGDDWNIVNPQKLSAKVPGSVFIDLMEAGIIDDPYYGNNPNIYKSISNQSWTYTKQFTISAELLNKNIIQLVSEGLDTKADVFINNKLIYTNDNMWHRNYIEIKSLLNVGTNNITIKFYSKVKWALEEMSTCNISTDLVCNNPDCKNPAEHGFCAVSYIRTEQCSFGWDWVCFQFPVFCWL